MSKNFWLDLPQPFSVMAPLYDVTDAAFRAMITKYSKPQGPDVFVTEFVSADGLCSDKGRPKLLRELYFTPDEQPIVAQLFTSHPDKMKEAAKLVRDLGFSGLDINMGCPDKAVMKQGSGIALCRTPTLAQEMIAAAKEGMGDLPVSVKTRLGYSTMGEWEKWLEALLAAQPALVTVHLRTMKELSKVPAHWELAKDIAQKIHEGGALAVANGDIQTPADGMKKAEANNLDGYMLGRGIFGTPWLWSEKSREPAEIIRILSEHITLFNELYGDTATNQKLFGGHTKNFAVMKKHFKAYLSGFDGAPELRSQLMETETAEGALGILSASKL